MNKIFIIPFFLITAHFSFGQYVNQTANVYSSKKGNLFIKASYTSTNRGMADRTIYLKSRNRNSNTRDMITWTNGGYKEVREFIFKLIYGLDRPIGTTFQVKYMYSVNVMDANNVKVINTMGGFSYFNRKEMLLLLQAINDKE